MLQKFFGYFLILNNFLDTSAYSFWLLRIFEKSDLSATFWLHFDQISATLRLHLEMVSTVYLHFGM